MLATQARLAARGIETAEEVRRAGDAMVAFSAPMAAADRDIKTFLFARMYRHPEVNRMRAGADKVVRGLFAAYVERPQDGAGVLGGAGGGDRARARASADYIAGMTDRFALNEYRRLFDPPAL